MKLVTNENNTNTLKIVIASVISKKPIEICASLPENKFSGALPQLILDSGTHVFSSNVAAKFLFLPSPEEAAAVNYYLDFESAVLQPLTALFTTKMNVGIKKHFVDVLDKVEQALNSKEFLAGDRISVGDIVVWSTLYPLFTDSKVGQELFVEKNLLKAWFEKILKLQEVQAALKLYSVQRGVNSLGNLPPPLRRTTFGVAKPDQHSVNTIGNPLAKKCNITGGSNQNSSDSPKDPPVAITEAEKNEAAAAWVEKPKRFPKLTHHPVLPKPGEKNILITSALPYVNNVPHLGNIIGCVLSGDVFARYCRLRGYNTLYICGTDEYGTATETKALEEKLTPQQICDKYFKIHDSIYKWFNISFDHFGRTTTPQQTEICQDIFKKVHKNGYILAESVEQLLCEKCDRYLADRFVEGTCPRCGFDDARGDQCDGCGHLINAPELINPRCKMCQQTPVLRHSKQFFLDLPKVEPLLRDWMKKSWTNWSHNAREISKAWLNDGLKPRCITRDLKWGIPVPLEGFQNKVFYVWFDAPIGYISITKSYTENWEKWWMPDQNTEVNLYQFMAKDNVPFHSVMFPASLLATKENYVLANYIYATEYLNYEDGKFSKSRGIGVFGTDAQDTGIPADVWRFYLLYVRPENQDSSFSWVDLAMKNNSELLSILGNFINRALVFCEKTYEGKVPEVCLGKEEHELLVLVNRELTEYLSAMEKGKLREGIKHMLAIARLGNQYMQSSQPWVLCKGTDDEKKRCGTVIGVSINLSCLLGQLIYPYMPETSSVIRKQLNSPPELNIIEDKFRLLLPAGHQIGKPFPLFNKIELDHIEKLKMKFCGRQKSKTPPGGDEGKPSAIGNVAPTDVPSLEKAVMAQGDVVRNMKAAGKDKAEWGPQVTVLLDLKKKLAEAKSKETTAASPSAKTVDQLEEEVKKQGDAVRKLKESGADKSVWQPEVNILLQLKKELAELKGEPLPKPSGKKNKHK